MKKWNVGWGVTSLCNMNCQFCYSKNVRESISDLKYADWIRFIDENHYLINDINYGTGENAICDDWFKLVDYVNKNYDIKQALTTNGFVSVRMKENQEYMRIISDSIQEIDVSLDFCDSEKHGQFRGQKNAFNWAMDTLQFCKENGIITTIVFIGTNETMEKENIKGLFEIANKYNAKLRMNIYRPVDGINEKTQRFVADYKTIIDTLVFINDNYNICSLNDPLFSAVLTDGQAIADPSGEASVRILPDGSITPSTYLISEKFRKCNIKDKKVLENLKFDKEDIDRQLPGECKDCEYSESCAGGVLDRRFLWYETFNARDPYCPKRNDNFLPERKVIVNKSDKFTSVHDGYLPTLFFTYQKEF